MRNTHTHARTQNLALREPILRLLHSNLHNLHRTAREKNQIDSNVTLNGNQEKQNGRRRWTFLLAAMISAARSVPELLDIFPPHSTNRKCTSITCYAYRYHKPTDFSCKRTVFILNSRLGVAEFSNASTCSGSFEYVVVSIATAHLRVRRGALCNLQLITNGLSEGVVVAV